VSKSLAVAIKGAMKCPLQAEIENYIQKSLNLHARYVKQHQVLARRRKPFTKGEHYDCHGDPEGVICFVVGERAGVWDLPWIFVDYRIARQYPKITGEGDTVGEVSTGTLPKWLMEWYGCADWEMDLVYETELAARPLRKIWRGLREFAADYQETFEKNERSALGGLPMR